MPVGLLALLVLALPVLARPVDGEVWVLEIPLSSEFSSVRDFAETRLEKGQVHHYPLTLDAGDYLGVEVAQRGVDVLVALHGPGGLILIEVDSPWGGHGTERFGFVAELGGRFEVVVWSEALREKTYAIRAVKRRPRSGDEIYAATCLRFFDAEELRKKGDRLSLDRALFHYRHLRQAWRRLDRPLEEAVNLYRLALVWQRLDKPTEGIRALEEALKVLDPVGDRTERNIHRAAFLLKLGPAYRRALQPQKARQVLEQARILAVEAGDRLFEARALNNLAILSRQQWKVGEALDFLIRARDTFRDLEQWVDYLRSLQNLGGFYQFLGEFDAAEEVYEDLLKTSRKLEYTEVVAAACLGLGVLRIHVGDPKKAFGYFDEAEGAVAHLTSDRVRRFRAKVFSGRGQAYLALKDWAKAEASHREALKIRREQREVYPEHVEKAYLGRALLAEGKPERALNHAAEALAAFRQAGDRDSVLFALLLISRIEHRLGRLDDARLHIEEALESLEEIRRTSTFNPASRLTAFEPRQRFYEHYVELLMDIGDVEAALAATERTRGRLLLELLAEARAEIRKGIPADLLERERRLWSQLIEAESVASDTEKTQVLIREYENLQKEIFKKNPNYRKLIQPPRFDLRSFQYGVLDDETLVLAFFLGETRSFLWWVTSEDFGYHLLPPRDEIETVARKFHEILGSGPGIKTWGPLRYQAAWLSRVLLGPVEGQLGSRRLVVVADGALHYVPFSTLPAPSDGRWLIERHEIVMAPSLLVLDAIRREPTRPPTRWTVGVLADAVFDITDERFEKPRPAGGVRLWSESYERLGYSRREAEWILEMVGPRRGAGVFDFDATREKVLGGWFGDFDIVHLATHGRLSTNHPELSSIVLSRVDEQGRPTPHGGLLTLHDVYNLDLSAELVVLSACRTALGREVRGEGLVGLTRGFMYAGAPRLLVSLWDVNDRITAELMKRFYQALLIDGESPAAALRTAQLSMLEGSEGHHPYFWAAFVLQGDWR